MAVVGAHDPKTVFFIWIGDGDVVVEKDGDDVAKD
jgi:hypothetical protein